MDFISTAFSLNTFIGSSTLRKSSRDHSIAPAIRGALRDRGGWAYVKLEHDKQDEVRHDQGEVEA